MSKRGHGLARLAWTGGLALMVVLFVAACTSFHTVSVSEARAKLRHGDDVRITTLDGQELEFEIDHVGAEGLVGESGEYPFDQISRIEVKRFDLLKSLGLYLVISTVLLFMMLRDGDLYSFGGMN